MRCCPSAVVQVAELDCPRDMAASNAALTLTCAALTRLTHSRASPPPSPTVSPPRCWCFPAGRGGPSGEARRPT
eukprot:11213044-Alexandrium_andersonii.AAC.1